MSKNDATLGSRHILILKVDNYDSDFNSEVISIKTRAQLGHILVLKQLQNLF